MSVRTQDREGPLAVIGAGRAGESLASAVASAGRTRVLLWARDPRRAAAAARRAGAERASDLRAVALTAKIALLAVSDDAVSEMADRLAEAAASRSSLRIALHASGVQGADRLAPLRRLGMAVGVFHPAVSLHGSKTCDAFRGAFVTVSGDPAALRCAGRIARSIGARPVTVDDADRPLIHLAAVMAAGDAATLLGLSERLMLRAGLARPVARDLVARLAGSVVDRYRSAGAVPALTGPLPRADVATVGLHAEALPARERRARDVHRALLAAGAELLVREGKLTRRQADAVREAFGDE